MARTKQDIWSSWLLKRCFGGDEKHLKSMMDFLLPIRDKVLFHANIQNDDVLLDVGCGDGLVSYGALQVNSTCNVVFADISLELLQEAQKIAEQQNLSHRCQFESITFGRNYMDNILKSALAQQFGATIDMLEKVISACPDQLWTVRLWDEKQLPQAAEFWYIVYHTLFWLDLYLSGSVEGFMPPAPFTLDELDPAGIIPEKPFTKDGLLTYLEHCRNKCQSTIEGLTAEKAGQRCSFPWGEVTFAALLMDNMRHVQEHVAQLNMILGQKSGWSPGWITRAKKAAG